VQDRRVPRAQALRAKLEAAGWVMVRFLRRGHSLHKTGSHNSNQQQQLLRERYLDRSGSDTGEMYSNGAGGTPPLANSQAAAAGAARLRQGRDGPLSGTLHHAARMPAPVHPPDFIHCYLQSWT
jgi:hypothetical protein